MRITTRAATLFGLVLACTTDDGRESDGAASVGIDPSAGPQSETGETEADDVGTDDESGGTGGTGPGASTDPSDTSPGSGPKFDLSDGDAEGVGEAESGCESDECECTIPDHVPCDGGNDLFQAIGLNCPGELQVDASTMGPASAYGVKLTFGGNGTFTPREGMRYAVIGSGLVADLDSETPGGDSDAFPTHCNDDIGAFDPGGNLPAPLRTNDVGGDCIANAGLIGTGDCSNTINGQFSQGGDANDYVEMRFELDVPPDVISFSYDFAFFSTEYPFYFGSEFNDMYIGWLESELWTGNISFDGQGNPISLNAGFLDFKDDAGNLPEFDNTCMKQHAGTNWLTTTAGVAPGEHITVVFAIFDLSDSILDSYAFIDNFQWGCDPTGMPSTEPEG
jgi:hypothetical protein